jgi:hypothetical protein
MTMSIKPRSSSEVHELLLGPIDARLAVILQRQLTPSVASIREV